MNDELTPESPSPEPEGPVTRPFEPEPEPDPPAAADTAPPSTFGPPGAGGMIRAARQAQGIDLASLAAMLKIPLRRIEALEQGRHEELQGATFERALAQAACRVLKIDPKPVLALLPQHERNTLERVSEGINTPFRERQSGSLFDRGGPPLRPALIIALLFVVAALALLYVPEGLWAKLTHPVVAGAAAGSAPAASDPAAAASATTTAAVDLSRGDAAASSAATAVAPTPVTPAATPGVPPTTAPATVAATTAGGVDEVLAHSEASPTIPLQVMATADSWVEVVDAQGHSLLSRTVVAGESVGLDGALPMRVKIGNARGTRLTLRGDNVDLAPWTRDNVARLELK